MRLINVQTLELVDFQSSEIPRYAILSHRWLDEEVSFPEFEAKTPHTRSKSGYHKIELFCKKVRETDIEWAWADTCCIDKRSSAELSEAINSMYMWYQNTAICLVYLSDVSHPTDQVEHEPGSPSDLLNSKWHTRGWTLQELLAPKDVRFYSRDWRFMGSKWELAGYLSEATQIDIDVLHGKKPVHTKSIAQRMSWASRRQTSRPEDMAYCLLGIFQVNMPMLYGEGDKAFRRLQEEIMKESDDPTLFAWRHTEDDPPEGGLLARHPRNFLGSRYFVDMTRMDHFEHTTSYDVIKRGITISLLMDKDESGSTAFPKAVLKCTESNRSDQFVQIQLRRVSDHEELFVRLKMPDLEGVYMKREERRVTVLHKTPQVSAEPLDTCYAYLYLRVRSFDWKSRALGESRFMETTSRIKYRALTHCQHLLPQRNTFDPSKTEQTEQLAVVHYGDSMYYVSDPSLYRYLMFLSTPGEVIVKLEILGLPGLENKLIAIGLDQRGLISHHVHSANEVFDASQAGNAHKLPFESYYDPGTDVMPLPTVYGFGGRQFDIRLVEQERIKMDDDDSVSVKADLIIECLPRSSRAP